MALPGKVSLRKAMKETGGVISDLATHFSVTRQTVYRWMDHYEMRHELSAARTNMREVAKDVLYEKLIAGDVGVAMFVTRHLTADGEMIVFSPEVLRAMEVLGIQPSEAVQQFETLVKAEAQKKEMATHKTDSKTA
ncbi:MAG: hypothetical protein RLP44_02460 [Aggregatilineales bacterium]